MGNMLNMCPVLCRSSRLSELTSIKQLISIELFSSSLKRAFRPLSVVLHQLYFEECELSPLPARGQMYIFSVECRKGIVAFFWKGLPRSLNVMFPRPRHSVTSDVHTNCCSREFGLKEWRGCGHSCLGLVWRDKCISGHVNNVEVGYKRSGSESGAITKYHVCWAQGHSFCSGKSLQSLVQNHTTSWSDCITYPLHFLWSCVGVECQIVVRCQHS